MTKKHLQFCIYYMQVGDPQVAYKMTYPRAAVKSLKASVSRLMARPDVAEWVNGTEERVHNRMMRKFYSEHYDQFKEKLLTINEKRTVLTKIIKGETKRVRYIKGKYGLERVEEDLPVYAVLRAVDLDTRLENFYNYLTHSDTWRKAQNIYVNTPTLQQQVNILISQTNEKEENPVVQADIESPLSGAPIAIGVGVHSRGTLAPDTPEPEVLEEPNTTQEQTSPPLNLAKQSHCHQSKRHEEDNNLAKQSHEKTRVTPEVASRKCGNGGCPLAPDLSPAGGGVTVVTGVGHSRCTPPSPPCGEGQGVRSLAPKKTPHFLTTEPVSSLTPKKIINKLTTVNKPVMIPCQSTTYEHPIFPPVKPHLPPPDQ